MAGDFDPARMAHQAAARRISGTRKAAQAA